MDKFSRTLIGFAVISCIFLVKFTNGDEEKICVRALVKLGLPPSFEVSCTPATISYDIIDGDQLLNISIELLDNSKVKFLNLKRTDGILANKNTPVFIANDDLKNSERKSYPRDEKVMNDIGQFSFYQNYAIKATCELYKDELGENIYGTVGLDTRIIGIGLESQSINEYIRKISGTIAVITVTNGKNMFELDIPMEIPITKNLISGKIAYPEILLVADYSAQQRDIGVSTVDFIRKLFLFWNAADMLFSVLESPRIRLNIARIVIAKNTETFLYLDKLLIDNNRLPFQQLINYVQKDFYNRSDVLPLDSYDYAIIFTGHKLCSADNCVNGRVSSKPNTVNKTIPYQNRVGTAAILNVMGEIPGEIIIAKKLGQLMGGKLIEEEDAERCPGIMDDYSTVATKLEWSQCSVDDLSKFYKTPEAGGLWNYPNGLICNEALNKLQLPTGYVGSCISAEVSYVIVEGDEQLSISIKSQNGKEIILQDLQQTEGILANESTSILIAKTDLENVENKLYFIEQNVMKDIGKFRFYQNYEIKTTCELYSDKIGENIYGIVGLDTMFIGTGLNSEIMNDNSKKINGIVALITLANGNNIFEQDLIPTEISVKENITSDDIVYPELLLIIDYPVVQNLSRVELVRKILSHLNAADMLFSSLQSPRVQLNIAGILIAENDDVLSYFHKSSSIDNDYLQIHEIMKYVEGDANEESDVLLSDKYDAAIVVTGNRSRQSIDTDMNDLTDPALNAENEYLNYEIGNNIVTKINIMVPVPTQILITKTLGQLWGAQLVRDESDETDPGIMAEHSSMSTSLEWSNYSVNELHEFFNSFEALGMRNNPKVSSNQRNIIVEPSTNDPILFSKSNIEMGLTQIRTLKRDVEDFMNNTGSSDNEMEHILKMLETLEIDGENLLLNNNSSESMIDEWLLDVNTLEMVVKSPIHALEPFDSDIEEWLNNQENNIHSKIKPRIFIEEIVKDNEMEISDINKSSTEVVIDKNYTVSDLLSNQMPVSQLEYDIYVNASVKIVPKGKNADSPKSFWCIFSQLANLNLCNEK